MFKNSLQSRSNVPRQRRDQTKTLDAVQWQQQQTHYINQVAPVVRAHQARQLSGEKHPVIDFLFEYYHFKPSRLLQWSPGLGVNLLGKPASKFLVNRYYSSKDGGVFVDAVKFPLHRHTGLDWIINLLDKTAQRQPSFGCLGLHEWCMVYEKTDIRHCTLPLRLSHTDTRAIVESHLVDCSHYDAYRFYSGSAVQFNRQRPTREGMHDNEQPGCLHTNMDLYRWSSKFHPWISSDLIGRCFSLALEIRETDMRASPYNLEAYCEKPAIRIESPEGKAEYISLQRLHFEQAKPLRNELRDSLLELKLVLQT